MYYYRVASKILVELKLHVELELGDFWHWVSLIPVVLVESIEKLITYVKFYGVVTGCNSLDVKVNELGLLYTFDVVKVDDSEKIYEHDD